MSRLTINIKTDNAAFGETRNEWAEEVADILHKLAGKIMADPSKPYNAPNLLDSNGNTVGQITVED